MNKIKLSLIFLLIISNICLSQIPSIVWNKTISIGSGSGEAPTDFIKTIDGGFILVGVKDSDIWLVKLNSNRVKMWSKVIGGNGTDSDPKIVEQASGNFYISSTSNSNISGNKTSNSFGSTDLWVLKFDVNGNILWNKTIGGDNTETNIGIVNTSDGGIMIGASTNSNISGNKSGNTNGLNDYWFVKMNTNGQIIWDKNFGGASDDFATKIIADNDKFLISGYSTSNISGDKSENSKGGPEDFWIIKIDENGQKIWDKTYGGSGYESKPDIIVDINGGYVITGRSTSNISGDKTENRRFNQDFWVVKVNTDGIKLWDKTYGYKGIVFNQKIINSPNNGYYLAGDADQNAQFDKTSNNHGTFNGYFVPSDTWLVRLDFQGNKLWDKSIGGNESETMPFLATDNDGSLYILSTSFSNISGDKTENNSISSTSWLLKLQEQPYISCGVNPPVISANPQIVSNGQNSTLTSTGCSGITKWYSQKVEGMLLATGTTYSPTVSQFSNFFSTCTENNCESERSQISISAPTIESKYFLSNSSGYSGVIGANDGGYIIVNPIYANPPSGLTLKGGYDFYIYKIDKNKIKIWETIVGGANDDRPTSIIRSKDGGFLVAGTSASGISGDKTQINYGYDDYWVVKFDANGNKIWDKTFGNQYSEYAPQIIELGDNNLMIAGGSWGTGGPNGNKTDNGFIGENDFWIVKLASNGQKLWDNAYGGTGSDIATDLTLSNDGNILILGNSNSNISMDKSSNSKGSKDYWLLKIDENGNKIWDKTYGGSNYDSGQSVVITNNNQIYLSGTSSSNISGDKTENSLGYEDYWVLKLNSDGQVLSNKTIGTIYSDNCNNSNIDCDDNLYINGFSINVYPSQSAYLATKLVKISNSNQIIWEKEILDEYTTASEIINLGNSKILLSSRYQYIISESTDLGCFSKPNPPVLTAPSLIIYTNQSTTLLATGCESGTVKWYDKNDAICPIGTGNSYISAPLSSSTKFYATCQTNNCLSETRSEIEITVTCPPGGDNTTIKSGNWDDISVWSCGRLPLPTDNVIISAGHLINVINSTYPIKSIILNGTINLDNNSNLEIQE